MKALTYVIALVVATVGAPVASEADPIIANEVSETLTVERWWQATGFEPVSTSFQVYLLPMEQTLELEPSLELLLFQSGEGPLVQGEQVVCTVDCGEQNMTSVPEPEPEPVPVPEPGTTLLFGGAALALLVRRARNPARRRRAARLPDATDS